MLEIINSPWGNKFFNYISQARKEIKVCCPYVKSDVLKEVYNNKKDNVQFELITKFKIANFYNEASDLEAIEYIRNRDGDVKAYQSLHAKIYIFDQKSVVVTSANLTKSGLVRNYEYGIYTDESTIVSKVCNDYYQILNDKDCVKITNEIISDAKNIIKNAPPRVKLNIPNLDITKSDGKVPYDELYSGGQESIENGLTGWKKDVFNILNKIEGKNFNLQDVYRYEPELKKLHPENDFITDKIRQQLQILRDLGLIEFLGNGKYEKLWI